MSSLSRSTFTRRGRSLVEGQRSELTIVNADDGKLDVILVADEILEAPNWTPDGETLVFNAGGEIWTIPVDGKQVPVKVETGSIRDINNDHVLSPDGNTLYLSSDDGHLYCVPITGGEPRRVSNVHATPHHYYLHGISPDGDTLSYVAVEGTAEQRRVNLFTIPARGGSDVRLTDVTYPNDGPEYSPDGAWIYFSSERAASRPGHAQCFRMRPNGSDIEQLTFDQRVNWFPHVSPDGRTLVYISYPEGTIGHPPNKDVLLRLMTADGKDQRNLVGLFGGQGTLNVNSWAPDSRRLAYVAYPIEDSSAA